MEALQEYGVYMMVLGGLLIIAGLILGYLSTLPTHSSTLSIPTVVSTNAPSTTATPSATSAQVPSAVATAASAAVVSVASSGVAAGVGNGTYEDAPHVTSPLNDAGTAPAPTSSATGSINIDVIEKLERLNRLRELGTITQEEYTVLRQQIMNT